MTWMGLALTSALAMLGTAQAAGQVQDAPAQPPAEPVSIPFVLRDNLITLDARVNDHPIRVVLDSGTSSMVVDRDRAKALGIAEGASAGNALGAGREAAPVRTLEIASLMVGPLRFAHVEAHSIDLGQLSASAGFPIELLIGGPAFQRRAVTVDYRRRQVTFAPSRNTPACAAPIPLRLVEGAPVVDVLVRIRPDAAPVPLKLVVDLGTRHQTAIIGGPFLRSEAGVALLRSGTAGKVGHGVGGAAQGRVARVAELRAGPFKTSDVEVALTPDTAAFEAGLFDGTLGVPLWERGTITFDYPAGQLCIER